jgi:hypothetical protein
VDRPDSPHAAPQPERPAEHGSAADTRRTTWTDRAFMIGLVVLVAGSGIASYVWVIRPGDAKAETAVAALVRAARAGSAPAPRSAGPSTDAALRALAASSGYAIDHSSGGFGCGGTMTQCLELTVNGPSGRTDVILRLAGEGESPIVTHLGLAPPCICQDNGETTHCAY